MSEDFDQFYDFEEAAEAITPDDEELEGISELALRQLELEDLIANLEERVKQKKAEWRDIAMEKLPQAMKDAGVSDFTAYDENTDTHVQLKLDHKVKASITAKNKEAAHEWLRENGFGDLIKEKVVQENVHPQTLMAFAREQLQAGKPLPDKLFGIFEFDVVALKIK